MKWGFVRRMLVGVLGSLLVGNGNGMGVVRPRDHLLLIPAPCLQRSSSWLEEVFLRRPKGPERPTMSTSRSSSPSVSPTLQDWAGAPEIVQECRDLLRFLTHPSAFAAMGATLPRGILLEGPPGVGKTMLAKAMANEWGATFYPVSGAEFVEMYVGVGSRRIRDLFQKARQSTPCLLFIDEIDAVGRARGMSSTNHVNEEREQTLNQLLIEMDGFASTEPILVMAATNRRDILDPALLRAGRFDRCVTIPLPDRRARYEMLLHHMRRRSLAPWSSTEMDRVLSLTDGCSGADLATVVNEASIQAVLQNDTTVRHHHVLEALERAVIGVRKQIDDRPASLVRRMAIHEIGHALAVHRSSCYEVEKISLHSTYQNTGGYTWYRASSDTTSQGLTTVNECFDRLAIYLGGKIAEEVFYGDRGWSTGSVQDLKDAHAWVENMVFSYGMSSVYTGGSVHDKALLSEKTRASLELEKQRWIRDTSSALRTVLRQHQSIIEETLLPRLLDTKELDASSWSSWCDEHDIRPCR